MSSYFEKNIPLIENIYTWQGEGPNCGKQMVLLRHKRCNRHCPFCDTWKKMGESDETFYSISDIDSSLHDVRNVMITGGEPLMKYKSKDNILCNYDATVKILKECSFDYADIETNGSVNLKDFVSQCKSIMMSDSSKKINVSWSPKFDTIKDIDFHLNTCFEIKSENKLENLNSNNILYPTIKLVIASEIEEEFLYRLIYGGYYDKNRIYLMPLGCTLDEIQKSFPKIVQLASKFGCHISSRLHLVHNFD